MDSSTWGDGGGAGLLAQGGGAGPLAQGVGQAF